MTTAWILRGVVMVAYQLVLLRAMDTVLSMRLAWASLVSASLPSSGAKTMNSVTPYLPSRVCTCVCVWCVCVCVCVCGVCGVCMCVWCVHVCVYVRVYAHANICMYTVYSVYTQRSNMYRDLPSGEMMCLWREVKGCVHHFLEGRWPVLLS